ncbi:hypothetical protein [Hydrogenophaga sp.]|uniref:hypothetical protein n=1 Tax=Hydrogenophaga sp. TaxID=1904254 RepID=UPI003D09C4CE
MDEISRLVEQHFLISASHLKHIDEMMDKARQAQALKPAGPDLQAQLAEIERERFRLGSELAQLQGQPKHMASEVVHKSAGVKGVLETVGLQLERLLQTLVDRH